METKDFYYDLPPELIAQHPAEPRDSSRMLVFHRATGEKEHKHFYDILDYLRPGDALVINDTKVIPARLMGTKEGTEREVEFLLLERKSQTDWDVILRPGKKLRPGDRVVFSPKLSASIVSKGEGGVCRVSFLYEGVFEAILDELGQMPLPPYITEKLEDKTRYQTVYAREDGSAAAPTAGLHFTPQLLEKIREMGVTVIPVLLHVGLGTFRPVKVDKIEEHVMHSEFYRVTEEAARQVNDIRRNGGRIIAVGTTSVRTLESAADENGQLQPGAGHTSIFIYPGYKFRCVDALITNFHLPESTLLMLISAFAGKENVFDIYKEAVDRKYRFFSFGDATLFL